MRLRLPAARSIFRRPLGRPAGDARGAGTSQRSSDRPRAWREWTLRTRMVLAIATLAAIGIVVTDLAGVVMLRNQLIQHIDDQLRGEARGGYRGQLVRNTLERRGPFGPEARFLAYYADGTPFTPPAQDDPKLGGFASLKAHADSHPYTVNGWRVLVTTLPQLTAGGPRYAVSAVSLTEIGGTESQLLIIDLSVSTLVIVLIALAAATVVRLGLRPLTRMEHTATVIAGGDLSRRVESTDPHTEAGRLGIALNAMLGQIESALAARTASEQRLRQFLADASHELRTPLTSIQGFAELYRRGGARPGPALDEAMGRIEAEAARMALLVSDLMLLARMDEERPLDRHPVDLLEVAADAVRDAHAREPQRPLRLDPPAGPPVVDGDEARLRQVVTNLVANALQHTPAGTPVTIRVGTGCPSGEAEPVASVGEPPPSGTAVAVLEVADSGPGLDGGQAARVFERLYRADPSRVRSAGGAGLGLAIVAAIVTAHRGRVELRTAPGAGAAFRVILPVCAAPETEPAAPRSGRHAAPPAGQDIDMHLIDLDDLPVEADSMA